MIDNCVSTDSGKTIEWEINSRKIVKKYDYQVYFEIGELPRQSWGTTNESTILLGAK